MLISKKVWFISTVVAIILYATMMWVTIPQLHYLSNGLAIPDVVPGGYDVAYIDKLFSVLGEDGRNYYTFVQLPLDMVYPASFSLMSIHFIYYGIKCPDVMKKQLCLLPIFSMIFDYIENFGILFSLVNYPNVVSKVIQISSIASLLKTVTVSCVLVVLLILGICALRRMNHSKRKTKSTRT